MLGPIESYFASTGFMPHGHCFLWTPSLVWSYVLSDSLIAASYYSIPIALWYFVRKRRDLPFRWIFVLFGLFVMACGTTHLIEILNIWEPAYWIDVYLKGLTAVTSVATAALLWPLIPRAMLIPSQTALQMMNQQLRDEITQRKRAELELREANAQLEARGAVLEAKSLQLETINVELEASQRETQMMLRQLVESEKLAALGSIVAGVAHELNTPLGNALIVTTTLENQISELSERFVAGTLKKSTMDQFILTAQTAVSLITTSTKRAARLVSQFKGVAVDQVSGQQSKFDLAHTIDSVLESIKPSFKHAPIDVIVNVPEGIVLDSFPGPFEQVIINIVMNAVNHAFPNGRAGRITIQAGHHAGNVVRVSISDDGIGMPPEIVAHIFEPFFTTKMGRGGSGLGLHIVRNLVLGILAGRINVHSDVGVGTSFEIELAQHAPDVAHIQN